MLERKDAITNEVLEPVTFVLAYPTVKGVENFKVCCERFNKFKTESIYFS
jgi:hypothetical protein